jgi:hypothetical protein
MKHRHQRGLNSRDLDETRASGWAHVRRLLAAFLGMFFAGSLAFAAWSVSLNGGSSGQAQSSTVQNLTMVASALPSPTNLLYPNASGDVVVVITNPNPFPVTISAVLLPTNTTYATGYIDSALTTPNTNCTNTESDVYWNYSTTTSGSSHTLTTPLVVGAAGTANEPLEVTFSNDGFMASSSPSGCENSYFSMPSLIGVTASSGGTAAASPATDNWSS